MAYTNFITITDRASTEELWNGSDVVVLAGECEIGGNNIISSQVKTMQITTPTTADTTAGDDSTSYINNFNRRKSNVSYAGFTNQNIKISAVYDEDMVSDVVNIGGVPNKIWTPSKLYELVLKPRTVYIKDQTLVSLLSAQRDTSPKVYNAYGIPVVLNTWTITPSPNNKKVTIEMDFIEDKEI